jgi:hypothetical protein
MNLANIVATPPCQPGPPALYFEEETVSYAGD